MPIQSPVVLLFDANGVAHAVQDGALLPAGTPGLVIAGRDSTGTARFAAAASDGDMLVRDDYDTQETLADQAGAGAVLTFNFSAEVQLVIIVRQGLTTLTARATCNSLETPTATFGIPIFSNAPTYLPVRTSTVKVFASAALTISVSGLRRT